MTTEIHHGQPEANDSGAVSAAVLPVNSVQGEMTEYEYECMLEATQAERARQAQEAVWEADPDWLAFRTLCYSDTGTPDAASHKERCTTPDCGCSAWPCAGTMPTRNGVAPGRWAVWYSAGHSQSGVMVSVSSEEWRPDCTSILGCIVGNASRTRGAVESNDYVNYFSYIIEGKSGNTSAKKASSCQLASKTIQQLAPKTVQSNVKISSAFSSCPGSP